MCRRDDGNLTRVPRMVKYLLANRGKVSCLQAHVPMYCLTVADGWVRRASGELRRSHVKYRLFVLALNVTAIVGVVAATAARMR